MMKKHNRKPCFHGLHASLGRKGLAFVLASVGVIMAYGETYYVDAVNGNDDWTGTAETRVGDTNIGPRKTLAKIVEVAKEANDEIIALPGSYDSGSCGDNETHGLSRVLIPAGVTLKSRYGAESTFIIGEKSTHQYADALGRGTNALRCVQFGSNKSKIVGFTLCGGRTVNEKDGVRCRGGAVFGRGSVYDCIISNNVAIRGGAFCSVSQHPIYCYRTKIVNNDATYGTVSYQGVNFQNCLLYNKDSYAIYGNGCNVKMFNSTVIIKAANDSCFYDNCVAYNSLFIGRPTSSGNESRTMNFTNCVFTVRPSSQYAVVHEESCRVIEQADMMLDSDYRPGMGSQLIDTADKKFYKSNDEALDGDLLGGQRIYNGRLDIGCYEYDWRGSFADMLHDTRLSVVSASQDVVKDDSNQVKIAAGHSLEGEWRSRGGTLSFNVSVVGDGSFTFEIDDDVLAVVSESTSGLVSVKIPQGDHTFKMSCSQKPDATALVGFWDERIGTVFSVR